MRPIPVCFSLLLLAVHACLAGTAFEALKFLSPEQAQRVALIAGRDGTPEPDRWYILVHDPGPSETGLREIVVARGKKVADRSISQFAEKLSAADVIPAELLKLDSDKLAKAAMKFGTVNNVTVSAMHFDLRRSGPESAPLWTVICLDSSGTELGKLVVSAAKGNVIMHPGFLVEPDLEMIGERSTITARTDSDDDSRMMRRTAAQRRRPLPPPPVATPRPGFLQRLFAPQDKPKAPPR